MGCSPIRQSVILKSRLPHCPMIPACLDGCRNCFPIRLSRRTNHCPTIQVSLGVNQSCSPIHYSRTIRVSLDGCQNCCQMIPNRMGCRIVPDARRQMIRARRGVIQNCCLIRLKNRCRPMGCSLIRRSVILIDCHRRQNCSPMIPNCRSRRTHRVSQIGTGMIRRNYCWGWSAHCRDGSARQNPVNAKPKMARCFRYRTCSYAQHPNLAGSRQDDL